MLGDVNIIKSSDQSKYVYSGYRTSFNEADSCSFGNDFTQNFVIFGVILYW